MENRLQITEIGEEGIKLQPFIFGDFYDYHIGLVHPTGQFFAVCGSSDIDIYRIKRKPLSGVPLAPTDFVFMKEIRPFVCKGISKKANQRPLEVFSMNFDADVLIIKHASGTSRVELKFESSRLGDFVNVGEVTLQK